MKSCFRPELRTEARSVVPNLGILFNYLRQATVPP